MWWQRGAVLTLPFNLRAANFKNPLLCSTATRRSTLSSLLIKLDSTSELVRCHGTQWRFMEGEEMWWREHSLHRQLQKTLIRRRSYFYTVIITQADRNTDGDQRGKRTKRRKKRTKRVHFLPKIHQKYLEEWCIPKQNNMGCLLSPLSLLLKTSLLIFSHLSFFCGFISS